MPISSRESSSATGRGVCGWRRNVLPPIEDLSRGPSRGGRSAPPAQPSRPMPDYDYTRARTLHLLDLLHEGLLVLVVVLLALGLLGVARLVGGAVLHDAVDDLGGGHVVGRRDALEDAHLLRHRVRVLLLQRPRGLLLDGALDNEGDVEGHEEVAGDDPWRAHHHLVHEAAAEHAERALVQALDGVVRAAVLLHHLVRVDAHQQEVPQLPRLLQELHVP
mmetsp:Transcript_15999/g.34750  ORF Transcript_15999/g.34750 Transcript_15999/m.34750 type:complete len:219 (+) Transcript_15999:200-856(+)